MRKMITNAKAMQSLLFTLVLSCGSDYGTAAMASTPMPFFASPTQTTMGNAASYRSRRKTKRRLSQFSIFRQSSHRGALEFSPSDTNSETAATDSKQLARQLLANNTMPTVSDSEHEFKDPLDHYDVDLMTPMESEFQSLMNTFLTYSEQDIQSLTTTSNRYINYQSLSSSSADSEIGTEEVHEKHNKKKPNKRTKEDGIRYRVLYEGVQSGALEPAVLRSFTVLFEDYLPIRIAGRRIYSHLANVMEEVREERRGEILRAKDVSGWDWSVEDCLNGDSGNEVIAKIDIIGHARFIWDLIMDEALLLEHALDSDAEEEQSQEVGLISLPQLCRLKIDHTMMELGLVKDGKELESIVRKVVFDEEMKMGGKAQEKKSTNDDNSIQENGRYLEMTFVTFVRMIHQCILEGPSYNGDCQITATNFFQSVEQQSSSRRSGSSNSQGTALLLAAKAVQSGSSNTCKKRQKSSDRFNEYVSTFRVWERKFLGDGKQSSQLLQKKTDSRRLDILRGCFEGARNEKVVAALKIVYMDYTALRLAGDLIFKLMSKIIK